MSTSPFGRRTPERIVLRGLEKDMEAARDAYRSDAFPRSFDLYEQMADAYPAHAIAILAELHDRYRSLPRRDRYTLYQSRQLELGIRPGDQVLDVGSGHLPFPWATHLADITLTDHGYGRAGAPFQRLEGKQVFQCSVEKMPFADKQFDFVYCSHVLEHTADPEQACRELMRVARRGYIECPSPGKDVFLASARPSNHAWGVDVFDGRLLFTEYEPEQIDGLHWDILQQMHSAPLTDREKAFSALIYLRADAVNTMLLWDGSFEYEVRRREVPRPEAAAAPRDEAARACITAPAPKPRMAPGDAPGRSLRFLQVHTFYAAYLSEFRARAPHLAAAPFAEQLKALVADGFSGVHMLAPYMDRLGYAPQLVVANDRFSQEQWLREQGLPASLVSEGAHAVVRRQIEVLQPDVLYLSDPITFDGRFLATLRHRPSVVLGWRAANIPADTDWSGFDVMLSSLSALREVALKLGARSAEHFFPGYPTWMNYRVADVKPEYDVVFSGQWTLGQHSARNRYLEQLAAAASSPSSGFSLGLYLSGERHRLTPEVARHDLGGRFGVAMHRALRSGRIAVDARGVLEIRQPCAGLGVIDLAGRQTANMRIFEVTGGGVFLLSEHHDNLREYFEPGVEIETFRDDREMLDKIQHYLAHPAEREAIARRGQERCLRDYSMERRAEALDAIVRKHLPDSATAPTPAVGTGASEAVVRLRDEASQLVQREQYAEAFELLVRAKALRQPLQGLDQLRALCFDRMRQPEAAREALLEELRWFPDNGAARQRLEALQARAPRGPIVASDDGEFRALLTAIRPYTMVGEHRLHNLFQMAKRACAQDCPGDFVECGVAAGGSSALLAHVIKRHSKVPRRLLAFDSFSGMPVPTAADTHAGQAADATGWGTGTCAAPERSVREACAKVGAADVLTTVKGFFEDTLPAWRDRVGAVAVLHLDSDWYASTKAILDNLYDRISDGGLLQVDDYGHWEGCRKAIHEFEASRGLSFALSRIDGSGVWFAKPERLPIDPALPASAVTGFQAVDPVPMGLEATLSPNERFQLYQAVGLLPRRSSPLRFVDLGSTTGASVALAYMALKKLTPRVSGFCVESGGQRQLLQVLETIGPELEHLRLSPHDGAAQLAQLFRDGNLPELVFVDGDPSCQSVRQSILDYYPLLAPGGLMVFHGWLPPLDAVHGEAVLAHHGGKEPGVRQACSEILEAGHGLRPLDLPLLHPTDQTQAQGNLPAIPGVSSTIRVYRKP